MLVWRQPCTSIGRGALLVSRKRVRYLSDAEQAGFVQLPNVVLFDTRLSDGAKLLYSALMFFARAKDSAWPGQETLGAMFKVTDRTLRSRFRELEKAKLIETQQRGQGQTNLYRLLPISGWTGNVLPFLTGDEVPTEEQAEEEQAEEEQGALLSHPQSNGSSSRSVARQVVEHWRSRYSPKATIDTKRLRRAQARLDEGFTLARLKRAIDAAADDEWLSGEKAGSPGYLNRFETLMRDAEQVEHLERIADEQAPDTNADERAIAQLRAQGLHEEADEMERG